MMTIIYNHEESRWLKQKEDSHATIFQNYKKQKYKATHKRVSKNEFWLLPKIFIYENNISIVTGNQKDKGGNEYIKHCKSFDCSIDRVNEIVFLKERKQNNKVKEMVSKLLNDGVTIKQISKELDYRENSNANWDDDLFEYSTEELEQIESEIMKM